MRRLYAEVAVAQLSKTGEELCGDKVEISRTEDTTTVVLSDGLGSGVKANILATMTTKIASSMLKRGIPMEEVVSTIAETLPVCRERKIAYSTLHILTLTAGGEVTVVEFDSPATFLFRAGQVVPFPTREKVIAGKLVREGQLSLQEDDVVIAVSDGVVHAGIGGLLKLGWGWEGVAAELTDISSGEVDIFRIAQQVLACCNGYYLDQPGDDSTVVAVKLRKPRRLAILTGPPEDPDEDGAVVRAFLAASGKKAVAGGTTANIVSRVTGRPITVDLEYSDPAIPPTASLEGLDLVTEGVLTLTAATERLGDGKMLRNATRQDGATRLARLLLEADSIDFYAGMAVNPAHQNPLFPSQINIKTQVLAKLREKLEGLGKQVAIHWV
ncbi:MAG TPA: SpoIIE family protein phosphatase [Selenomonadales bacterium]|nr:SpoIIE family protein phosphatase [Selenomonadales bacterium]